jgi:hypothetical protein
MTIVKTVHFGKYYYFVQILLVVCQNYLLNFTRRENDQGLYNEKRILKKLAPAKKFIAKHWAMSRTRQNTTFDRPFGV